MNVDEINQIESENNTSTIHLFYNKMFTTWVAYDMSAYSLRLLVKARSYNCLRAYSEDCGLAFTMISSAVLSQLESEHINTIELSDDYRVIYTESPFDLSDFNLWKDRLKEEVGQVYHIETRVSKYIPKDQYIKDGMSSFSRNVKRCFDMFSSFCALLIFSPLILIVWICVKAEDGGPAIYKQERIGRFGRPFNIYKFRSMRVDAEKFGPQLSHSGGENDPRLTKVGKFIRSTHLDELPQLWNVFVGEMSFVGPRPERKYYIDQIIEHDKRYEFLYQIRPGVTSYATFYNGYTDTMEKMLKRLEYDLYYLKYRTWWFDLKILMKTFFAIVFGKKI